MSVGYQQITQPLEVGQAGGVVSTGLPSLAFMITGRTNYATAYLFLEIPVYRPIDEHGHGFPYRCYMSVDDIILALYGVGAIFPVVTLLASIFGRRDSDPI